MNKIFARFQMVCVCVWVFAVRELFFIFYQLRVGRKKSRLNFSFRGHFCLIAIMMMTKQTDIRVCKSIGRLCDKGGRDRQRLTSVQMFRNCNGTVGLNTDLLAGLREPHLKICHLIEIVCFYILLIWFDLICTIAMTDIRNGPWR